MRLIRLGKKLVAVDRFLSSKGFAMEHSLPASEVVGFLNSPDVAYYKGYEVLDEKAYNDGAINLFKKRYGKPDQPPYDQIVVYFLGLHDLKDPRYSKIIVVGGGEAGKEGELDLEAKRLFNNIITYRVRPYLEGEMSFRGWIQKFVQEHTGVVDNQRILKSAVRKLNSLKDVLSRRIVRKANEESYLDEEAIPYLRNLWPKLHAKAVELEGRYKDLINTFKNNIHKSGVSEDDWLWEFNIKLSYIDIPESVPDEVVDSVLYEYLDREVAEFIKWLKQKYYWIKDAYQAGRSGGWLVIVDSEFREVSDAFEYVGGFETGFGDVLEEDNVDDVIERLKEGVYTYGYATYYNYNDVVEAIEKIKEKLDYVEKVISSREKDLDDIDTEVTGGLEEVEREISSIEFWKQYM